MFNTKYRPKTLDEFYGNDSLKESLQKTLSRTDEITQAYLFTGPSGSGKSTLAQIVPVVLDIDPINQFFYNASNTRGIDTSREIINSTKHGTIHGRNGRRLYVLEECHSLTVPAQESLLDFLEKPPKDVFVVLTTTEPDKLKITLKRRCFQGEVKPLLRNEMMKLFKKVLLKEKAEVEKEVLYKIIKESNGSAGQALKFLDMVVGVDSEKAVELISNATKNESTVKILCQTLLDVKLNNRIKWKKCQEILKSIEGEPEAIRRGLLGYMNKVVLSSEDAFLAAEIASNFTENFYDSGACGLTLAVFACCVD